MQSIEDSPDRELLEHTFTSTDDATHASTTSANTGRQNSTNDAEIQRRLADYRARFQSCRYSVLLRVQQSQPEVTTLESPSEGDTQECQPEANMQQSQPDVNIQQSTPEGGARKSWKSWASWKATFQRWGDAMLPKPDASIQQSLPRVAVRSTWSDRPLLLREVINLVITVDISTSVRPQVPTEQAIAEQVEAAIQAIEEQLDSMSNVKHLGVRVFFGGFGNRKKDIRLSARLSQRLASRQVKTRHWVFGEE